MTRYSRRFGYELCDEAMFELPRFGRETLPDVANNSLSSATRLIDVLIEDGEFDTRVAEAQVDDVGGDLSSPSVIQALKRCVGERLREDRPP